ncbi:MAG TPA: hypothetical protein VGR39_02805, partial [Candidatus Acidoferrales bacterium]|nr:hypothetical protein [Candidatus Acidoferrales bacterium]
MKLTQRIRTLTILAGALLLVALLPVVASAQAKTHAGKSFAQKLVEATQAKHPEVDEVGISTDTRRGCYGIASTDKSDIGEKCENGGSN